MAGMAVLLPNCALSAIVRAHPLKRDARGRAIPTAQDETTTRGPFPGYAVEQPDQTWMLRADMGLWPLEAGDTITDGTRVWAVITAQATQVAAAPDVDSVKITATLEPPAHL